MKNLITLCCVIGLFLTACGDDTTTATMTPTFKSQSSRRVVPKFNVFREMLKPFRVLTAGDVGHNTAAGLTSLQYYVTRVDICNELTISGTGYSGQVGCVTVFGASNADNAYDTFKIADAEADTSDSWVDVVAGKTVAAKAIATGTYNYGIIETRKPIKVNATVTTKNGDHTLKTCTGGEVESTGSSNSLRETTTLNSPTTMENCTQAQVVLGSGGGGQWFKFQSPITLTKDATYSLDLVSNTVSLIAAGLESLGGWGDEASFTDGTFVMLPPPISVVPVLREGSQTTIREQYTLSAMTGIEGSIVLDLYFSGTTADVGTATIVGAGTRFVHTSAATTVTKMYNPYSVTTNSDGTVTINDFAEKAIVTSLTRSTTTTAGGTQSVTVNKEILYSGDTGTGTVSATATFNGLTEL